MELFRKHRCRIFKNQQIRSFHCAYLEFGRTHGNSFIDGGRFSSLDIEKNCRRAKDQQENPGVGARRDEVARPHGSQGQDWNSGLHGWAGVGTVGTTPSFTGCSSGTTTGCSTGSSITTTTGGVVLTGVGTAGFSRGVPAGCSNGPVSSPGPESAFGPFPMGAFPFGPGSALGPSLQPVSGFPCGYHGGHSSGMQLLPSSHSGSPGGGVSKTGWNPHSIRSLTTRPSG